MLGLVFTVLVSMTGLAISQETAVRNDNNLGTGLWEAVRKNNLPISSQVDSGGAGAIHTDGMKWQKFRSQQLVPKIAYAAGATLLLIFLFWIIKRPIPIPGGESGQRIQRTSVYERVIHWILAGNFILMAVTGFIILYGRSLIIPYLGIETYGMIAAASKTTHSLFGLIFPISIVLMFLKFVRRNLYERGDLTWLMKGGGMLSKSHPSAGFFNMGEKVLFWLVILFGTLISVSGLIMVFQLFEFTRTEMIITNTLHGVVAACFVFLIFGHIYFAAIGVKGTISAMTDGSVDKNWAKAHHDRWYEKAQSVKKS